MSDQKGAYLNEEPSVWDHVTGKVKDWFSSSSKPQNSIDEVQAEKSRGFPWTSLAALVIALIAQVSLEPSPNRTAWIGFFLYGLSFVCLVFAIIRKEWSLPPVKPEAGQPISVSVRVEFLLIGVIFAVFAFVLFGSGTFRFFNTSLWALSLVMAFLAFWKREHHPGFNLRKAWRSFMKDGWQVRITHWTVIVLAVIAVILFFNFYRLDSVPPEMLSDQAEKLLDINDILNGSRAVYFTRNTGREVIHFYLTAAYMGIFNLDVSFLNLKVVAVFANLLTLFFIFLLGKEFANKWVGLWAALFAGMAYWPLLFTRLALRIPYYSLFVAPVLYFFIRGLRRQNINDILLTGLFLGLGLHGYTPFRIVPFLIVGGILIYILHHRGKEQRLGPVYSLVLITLISLIVFIPLLRIWIAYPDLFAYRAFSRLTGMEVEFQAHPIVIFLQNFWRASLMFFWDNGVIWAHSVPGRPALEFVGGALYFIGVISLLIRYVRKRDWRDLLILVSIPILLMPSILSIAYPGENPSLNRTAGAVVPVFLLIGFSVETIIRTIRKKYLNQAGTIASAVIVFLLVVGSALGNFDLVFNQWATMYQDSSWNTSEIGEVAALFIDSLGSPETAYVVGYPHWVDSRLVAINAGVPDMDFAIFPEDIAGTRQDPRAKMFFLSISDSENQDLLQRTFQSGVLWRYDSDVENKDFMIFFVPPAQGEIN